MQFSPFKTIMRASTKMSVAREDERSRRLGLFAEPELAPSQTNKKFPNQSITPNPSVRLAPSLRLSPLRDSSSPNYLLAHASTPRLRRRPPPPSRPPLSRGGAQPSSSSSSAPPAAARPEIRAAPARSPDRYVRPRRSFLFFSPTRFANPGVWAARSGGRARGVRRWGRRPPSTTVRSPRAGSRGVRVLP